MAVYCVPIEDDRLLEQIRPAGRVLLVGCPSCANVCYARHRDSRTPVVKATLAGLKATSVLREARRLAEILKGEGVETTLWVPNYPAALCALDQGGRNKLIKLARQQDVIVTLSCESGKKNVEEMDTGVRVVNAMMASGILRGIIERKLTSYFLNRESVRVLPFTLEDDASDDPANLPAESQDQVR